MLHLAIIAILSLAVTLAPGNNCYSAYTPEGTHLIISDNGTPGYYDDDFICDYETNINYTITINE